MEGFVAEDHWSRNECPVRFSEYPPGGVWRRTDEINESLTGPFQTNRSDGIKSEIGIERKKLNLGIN